MSKSQEKLSRRAFLKESPLRALVAGVATKEAITIATSAVGAAALAACSENEGESPVGEKGASLNNGCSTKHLGKQGRCYPECSPDLAITPNGGWTWDTDVRISEGALDCARDRFYNRDCSEIRKKGERRIEHIPEMFECDSKLDNPKLRVGTSEVLTLNNFDRVTHKGDCSSIIARFTTRMQRVLRRIRCGRDGKPIEELGWGQAKGGRLVGGGGKY
ncbi:hypothetical protein ACFL3T_00450 [Patescibacteria group bacterium]